MKKMIKAAVISGLLAAGVAQTYADTNIVNVYNNPTNVYAPAVAGAATTNAVLNLNVALTGFKQTGNSAPTAARVDSKAVIVALNGLVAQANNLVSEVPTPIHTNNPVADGTNWTITIVNTVTNTYAVVGPITNNFADSNGKLLNKAKLVHITGPNVNTIAVRQQIGTNVMDTDVSTWLVDTDVGAIGTSKTDYEILTLTLTTPTLTLGSAGGTAGVSGYDTATMAKVSSKLGKFDGTTTSENATVAGTGSFTTTGATPVTSTAVLKGSVTANGVVIEKRSAPLK
jgi:hypothetical protein